MKCKYCKKTIRIGHKFRSNEIDKTHKDFWHEDCEHPLRDYIGEKYDEWV